jgi:hypothetical protein
MAKIPPIPQKKSTLADKPVKDLTVEAKKITKDFDIRKMFSNKIEQAIATLDVPLDSDDPDLIDQLTLGDKWDDPFELTKAMDRQPLYYARWATLLRKLKKERQIIQQKYSVWESIAKEQIQDEIFNENVKSGMTANNAKPTNQSVENRFNKYCSDKTISYSEEYKEYHGELDEIEEQTATVETIVKAFEQRKDMFISLGSLVRSMIDNNLLIYRQKNKTK